MSASGGAAATTTIAAQKGRQERVRLRRQGELPTHGPGAAQKGQVVHLVKGGAGALTELRVARLENANVALVLLDLLLLGAQLALLLFGRRSLASRRCLRRASSRALIAARSASSIPVPLLVFEAAGLAATRDLILGIFVWLPLLQFQLAEESDNENDE